LQRTYIFALQGTNLIFADHSPQSETRRCPEDLDLWAILCRGSACG